MLAVNDSADVRVGGIRKDRFRIFNCRKIQKGKSPW